MTQSSTADHEMLDATTVDSEFDQVFDQCQETQQAASHTLRAARITIAASSQTINPVPHMQIEPTRIIPKLQQINLPRLNLDFDRLMVFLDNSVRSLEVVGGSYSIPHKPEREQRILLTENNRSHKNGFCSPQCKIQNSQKRHPIRQCAK